MRLLVTDLTWFGYDLGVTSSYRDAQPVQPNAHLPNQILEGNGMIKIKSKPTKVRDHNTDPVFSQREEGRLLHLRSSPHRWVQQPKVFSDQVD